MEIACGACGATLDVNPNLAGAEIPCPSCGATVRVPAVRPARKPQRQVREPYSAWLFAAQTALVLLGLACLAGAFLKEGWNPPAWSFFQEPPLALVAAGVGFLIVAGVARVRPVLTTLLTALAVLASCALHYRTAAEVDASRTLALALAMLALWLALQHKRTARP